MKIGVAQIDCQVGDVPANLRTITSMVKRAASVGCDVVVLPEMADTGYDMKAILAHASTWDEGPYDTVRKLAADLHIAVICGLSEQVDDRVYNTVAVIDDAGNLVGKYRKAHLISAPPVCEDQYLQRGNKLALARLGQVTIGLMICYDIRFPEMARSLTLGGAEVLIAVAAWPTVRGEHWNLLTTVRAIENQVYLAASNRAGTDSPLKFCGNSCLIDPYGLALARADEAEQTLLVGEISRDRIQEVRSGLPVFDDRQPKLYGSIPQAEDQGRST